MGHVLQNHQVHDMRSEQGLNYLHPNDCIFLGSSLNSTNQSIPPVLPASGNSADLHLQFTDPSRRNCIADPYRRNCIHGNHYNGMQYCQPVSGNYVGEVAPANFYNPCLPSSSSRLLSIPINKRSVDHVLSSTNQRAFGTVMNDGRDNYSIDGLNEPRKRKNTEVVAENFDYYNAVGNSNFSSANLFLNSELSQWLEPYNYGGSSVTAFTVPGYQANGILTTTEDSHRLVKDRSSAISPQPVHPFSCHHNYLLQGNQMDQSFQPSGTCLNSGHLEVADTSVHEYQGNPPNRYAARNMHNPSFPYAYQNYSPVQIMQVQSYSYHTQMPAPSYWHPFNNLHADNVYALRNDQESCSRFVGPMPSISEQMYVPPIFGTVPGISYELRNPPFEDAMEIPQFYSFEDSFDQYSDMRMDIDDMSYEELLDLEEKIGDVKTGLSEEFVLKNLRTSMHVQQSTSLALGSLFQAAFENGTCMVCQVEYEDSERIGTLDCGHSYHADCIKQWLFVKNTCPICKAPALVANKKDG